MNYGKSTTVYREKVIHALFSLSRKKEIETKTVTLCHGMQTKTRGHDQKILSFINENLGGCK